eukprot:TRINITY_DN1668_c0_g1_i13.p1 TRINITY_DN1668_c0_g1~~TRINITY_DN1668_c0_g1_i13.p1  ORF type:complete len:142 (-),score=28.60 TRINITY_DN1668_c0_g1_i13:39-464(-)
MKGTVSVHWEWLKPYVYSIAVNIPHNTAGLLRLPYSKVSKLMEGDNVIWTESDKGGFEHHPGIKSITIFDHSLEIATHSGPYSFKLLLPEAPSTPPLSTQGTQSNQLFQDYIAKLVAGDTNTVQQARTRMSVLSGIKYQKK